MKVALEFYSLSYRTIEYSVDIVLLEDIGFILLALLNNICHIHLCLLNFDQTRFCIEGMRALMSTIATNYTTFSIVYDDYLFLYLNVQLTCNIRFLSIAPAA